MSLQMQLKRGLLALPIAGLLIAAGTFAPAGAHVPSAECLAAAAASAKQVTPARRVDFHSMLPGALHVLRKVEVPVVKG